MANKRGYLTEQGVNFYRTRAMSAGDPITLTGPQFRIHEKLGYVVEKKPRRQGAAATTATPTPEPSPAPAPTPTPSPLDHDGDGKAGGSKAPAAAEDMAALREAYTKKLGKRPFSGWDADTLREKMAAADEA